MREAQRLLDRISLNEKRWDPFEVIIRSHAQIRQEERDINYLGQFSAALSKRLTTHPVLNSPVPEIDRIVQLGLRTLYCRPVTLLEEELRSIGVRGKGAFITPTSVGQVSVIFVPSHASKVVAFRGGGGKSYDSVTRYSPELGCLPYGLAILQRWHEVESDYSEASEVVLEADAFRGSSLPLDSWSNRWAKEKGNFSEFRTPLGQFDLTLNSLPEFNLSDIQLIDLHNEFVPHSNGAFPSFYGEFLRTFRKFQRTLAPELREAFRDVPNISLEHYNLCLEVTGKKRCYRVNAIRKSPSLLSVADSSEVWDAIDSGKEFEYVLAKEMGTSLQLVRRFRAGPKNLHHGLFPGRKEGLQDFFRRLVQVPPHILPSFNMIDPQQERLLNFLLAGRDFEIAMGFEQGECIKNTPKNWKRILRSQPTTISYDGRKLGEAVASRIEDFFYNFLLVAEGKVFGSSAPTNRSKTVIGRALLKERSLFDIVSTLKEMKEITFSYPPTGGEISWPVPFDSIVAPTVPRVILTAISNDSELFRDSAKQENCLHSYASACVQEERIIVRVTPLLGQQVSYAEILLSSETRTASLLQHEGKKKAQPTKAEALSLEWLIRSINDGSLQVDWLALAKGRSESLQRAMRWEAKLSNGERLEALEKRLQSFSPLLPVEWRVLSAAEILATDRYRELTRALGL
jgi:hypothetical protein